MELIDTHCHLDGKSFVHDLGPVIGRALAAGVTTMVAIGSGDGPPDLSAGIRLAEAYPFIYATVGVHPHEASKADDSTWPELRALASHPKVVAIGEIGLDSHYNFSPPDVQREVFVRQLEIARDSALPIVIHTREAWDGTFSILESHWPANGPGGIMHCFSGGPAEAERSLAMGFHISFSGIVTYPKAVEVHEAARIVPLDRILIETDSPYLAPVPYRGKRNEPAFIVETARRLAELRGEEFETFAFAASANWRRLCLPETKAKG
ncbi:MAG: TatD family deoxyribonuclease [Candidatus Solibacter sp.]|nr:TatD family deoxyribonuclease [Candidatus Solibacter sp.]